MARPVTLFTGQWADLTCETMVQKAKEFGYDGLELACWGDHFEIDKADAAYCAAKRQLLESNGMKYYSISSHLVGQAVCDNIDERHKQILPDYIYGDVYQMQYKELIEGGYLSADHTQYEFFDFCDRIYDTPLQDKFFHICTWID